MIRLRSDIWVAAWLRRCASAGVAAYLRKRGAPEAGAIFIRVDCLNGDNILFGPADQAAYDDTTIDRLFRSMHAAPFVTALAVEEMLAREQRFDPDIFILDVEDRQGRSFADLVPAAPREPHVDPSGRA